MPRPASRLSPDGSHRRSRLGALRRRWLGVSPVEADFERRGFYLGHPRIRAAAERAVRHAFEGHGIALELGEPAEVGARLDALEPGVRCYAYEGAAIGLTSLDVLHPLFGRRHRRFLAGPARAYSIPAHAGVGMALGASRRAHRPRMKALEPFARKMVVDGMGFFYAYAHPRATIQAQRRPWRIAESEHELFDAGIGRALWFVHGGDPDRIAAEIERFEPPRRPALWSGVGVAATFLGGADAPHLSTLRAAAGAHSPRLMRGVALTVSIFDQAGFTPEHVDGVCRELCGQSAQRVAAHAREARVSHNKRGDAAPHAWEAWRSRTEVLVLAGSRESPK